MNWDLDCSWPRDKNLESASFPLTSEAEATAVDRLPTPAIHGGYNFVAAGDAMSFCRSESGSGV